MGDNVVVMLPPVETEGNVGEDWLSAEEWAVWCAREVEVEEAPVPDPGWDWVGAAPDDPVDVGPWPPSGLLDPVDPAGLGWWRDRLAATDLPGTEAGLIDLLRGLEELKSAAAAVQARVAVAFDTARRAAEEERGLARSKRGVGIGAEIALARKESPHRGSRLLGLGRALVTELPRTLEALAAGVLNEWRVTLIARETACLDPAGRARIDTWLSTHLADHPGIGDARLVAEVRRKVIEIDQAAVLRRRAAAAGGRRVGLRPLADGMVQLTAILELREGVSVYAALVQAADRYATEERGRGMVMADTLVERVTGATAADPGGIDLTIVITAEALLAASEEAAHVHGYGPMPAAWVRQLLAETADSEHRLTVRRLFRGPGQLIRLETADRFFTAGLRRVVAYRDQYCRTPWCGAPLRHHDHVVDHAAGGATSLANAQGLCEGCNYTKQHPGWRATVGQDPDRGHLVTTTTPTGHSYTSTPPTSPGCD